MLPYDSIVCKVNVKNIGGVYNSITPSGVPYFSKTVYCADFSKANDQDQWVFVHEMAHVWQWYHGIYPVVQAIGIFIEEGGSYLNAYPYTLLAGRKFLDYNIEQQASIVADYWIRVAGKSLPLQNNTNPSATLADYADVVSQFQREGPPRRKLDDVPTF
jgi:hypothetical protein